MITLPQEAGKTYKDIQQTLIMNKMTRKILLMAALMISIAAGAQEKIINPDITYAGNPRNCVIGGIAVSGVEGYEDYVLTGISGLTPSLATRLTCISTLHSVRA